MKNIVFLISFSFLLFFFPISIQAQWVQTNLDTGFVCLKSFDNTVFASTYRRAYRSTNNGLDWIILDSLPVFVTDFASCGTNIYASTIWNGVYISSNNGIDWKSIGPLNTSIYALAAKDNYVFAGSSVVVFRSTDYGNTWNAGINGLPYDPYNEMYDIDGLILFKNNVFAYIDYNYKFIFRSTNNGTYWLPFTNGLYSNPQYGIFDSIKNHSKQANINSVLSNPFSAKFAVGGTILYLAVNGVNYVSENDTIWTKINNGLTDLSISALATSGTNVFAATRYGNVFYSKDIGANWRQINEGLPSDEIFGMTTNCKFIFVGTYFNGVWRRPISEITGVSNEIKNIPRNYFLSQNYPNPFNPNTTIAYSLKNSGNVKLTVFNSVGSRVATIVDAYKSAGNYSVQFNGSGLASGIYMYRLESGTFNSTKKLILLK